MKRKEGIKQAYGIMPPMITCWKADGSFDEKASVRHLNWLIEEGITSASVVGSTGENISMTPEETMYITDCLVEAVDHRIPVYPAAGFYSTQTTIEVAQHAEKVGADGVLVIPPYYMNPHKRAVLDHFRELRKNIGIDIMLYDNPFFAGYKMDVKETAKLCEEGVIDAVKCAQGDVHDVQELQYLCGDRLNIFYGHDYDGLEALIMGGNWLTGSQNVLPGTARKLYDLVTADRDYDGAIALWRKSYMPLIDFLQHNRPGGDPHWLEVFKCALNMMGHEVGLPRKPMGDLEPDKKKGLEQVLMKCGVL